MKKGKMVELLENLAAASESSAVLSFTYASPARVLAVLKLLEPHFDVIGMNAISINPSTGGMAVSIKIGDLLRSEKKAPSRRPLRRSLRIVD